MTRPSAPRTRLMAAVAVLALLSSAHSQETKKGPARPAETTIDVKLIDDSTIKLTLLEGQIEFLTPHGKLVIPIAEIRKVELGMRIPDDVASQIRRAVADLGSNQFRKREEAMVLLVRHREKSYPALREAAKSTDAEVSKRVEELIDKLKETVPEGRLEMPDHDVIHTDLSRIAGRIMTPTLRARSFTFGDLQLKLSDTLAMAVGGFKEKEEVASNVLPDPGTLIAYQQPIHIGKVLTFRVTGAVQGSLWGTEMYTLDSSLAAAAVHLGVLKVGQTGNVKVMILGPSVGFVGSVRNGLTSANYANYPGAYRILPKER